MSKKRRQQHKSKAKKDEPHFPSRLGLERMTSDLSRLLAQQSFESDEELEAFVEALTSSGQPLPNLEPETPLQQAQDLMYEAWDEPTKKRRIALARKALAISDECADAYVLLAEETATTPTEAKELYEAGVRAGESALGEKAFEEYVGHFWGVTETRPYMRARAGLAAALWHLGQHDEAIMHYVEMLRLNPGDNQGIRYTLLDCLVEEGLWESAEELLLNFEDDISATWLYTGALLLFARKGNSLAATERLQEAVAYNPHVPAFLLGRRRPPRRLPPFMGMGDETEAAYYFQDSSHLWLQQEGALDWLREVVSSP